MSAQHSIAPPVVAELRAIFESLPDETLIAKLRGPKRRGRPGHDVRVVWRCYLARYLLGVESVSALLRLLRNNAQIAETCGVTSADMMPSQPTLSRFGTKLTGRWLAVALRNVQRDLTRLLYERLPDFGKSVAIDSTPIKGWSNPMKKGKRRSTIRRQRPRIGKVSDPDAGWHIKKNTQGNVQYTFGHKAHILCDTTYEMPLVVDTTAGNTHDMKKAGPLLSQARRHYRFNPEYVICDAGYSSEALSRRIKRHYWATPIIDPNPMHKNAIRRQSETTDWRAIFRRRTSIERINGRLKAFFALNSLRVRGHRKVLIHAHMSVIALQVRAVAFPERLRQCVG